MSLCTSEQASVISQTFGKLATLQKPRLHFLLVLLCICWVCVIALQCKGWPIGLPAFTRTTPVQSQCRSQGNLFKYQLGLRTAGLETLPWLLRLPKVKSLSCSQTFTRVTRVLSPHHCSCIEPPAAILHSLSFYRTGLALTQSCQAHSCPRAFALTIPTPLCVLPSDIYIVLCILQGSV
jgi:hypothetical protein